MNKYGIITSLGQNINKHLLCITACILHFDRFRFIG